MSLDASKLFKRTTAFKEWSLNSFIFLSHVSFLNFYHQTFRSTCVHISTSILIKCIKNFWGKSQQCHVFTGVCNKDTCDFMCEREVNLLYRDFSHNIFTFYSFDLLRRMFPNLNIIVCGKLLRSSNNVLLTHYMKSSNVILNFEHTRFDT